MFVPNLRSGVGSTQFARWNCMTVNEGICQQLCHGNKLSPTNTHNYDYYNSNIKMYRRGKTLAYHSIAWVGYDKCSFSYHDANTRLMAHRDRCVTKQQGSDTSHMRP